MGAAHHDINLCVSLYAPIALRLSQETLNQNLLVLPIGWEHLRDAEGVHQFEQPEPLVLFALVHGHAA